MLAAAIQFQPILGEKETNLRRAAELVLQAAKAGAKLVVLPELCTTGMSFMSHAEAEPFAEVLQEGHSRSMEVFGTLAQKFGCCVAWGLIEKDPGSGKLYNSQALITSTGKFISYRKINKWANDYLWASPGEANPPILEVEGKKIGLLICRDVRDKFDKDWSDFYEPGDADVVCLSANWGDGGFPAVSWMEFSRDNKMTLVVANRYGQEQNNNFGEGGVCVIYPDQRVVCEGLRWNADCIVYGEV
jgi:predicted amidohydrolase